MLLNLFRPDGRIRPFCILGESMLLLELIWLLVAYLGAGNSCFPADLWILLGYWRPLV